MQRILFVVLLHVVVSLACKPPPCHWADSNGVEFRGYFDRVANKLIAADRAAAAQCEAQSTKNTIESHLGDIYKVTIPNAGSTVAYDIQVRGRVVLIDPKVCKTGVSELWVLPDYVNGFAGSYYFEKEDLVLEFPYKFDVTVGGNVCELVNKTIVNIPVANINKFVF